MWNSTYFIGRNNFRILYLAHARPCACMGGCIIETAGADSNKTGQCIIISALSSHSGATCGAKSSNRSAFIQKTNFGQAQGYINDGRKQQADSWCWSVRFMNQRWTGPHFSSLHAAQWLHSRIWKYLAQAISSPLSNCSYFNHFTFLPMPSGLSWRRRGTTAEMCKVFSEQRSHCHISTQFYLRHQTTEAT